MRELRKRAAAVCLLFLMYICKGLPQNKKSCGSLCSVRGRRELYIQLSYSLRRLHTELPALYPCRVNNGYAAVGIYVRKLQCRLA